MSIGVILSLIGPAVSSLLKGLVDRFWNHGVSTLQGTAGGAAVLALIQSWGCNLDSVQASILAGIPFAVGALSTDSGSTSMSFLDRLKSVFLNPKVVTVASDSKAATP